MSRLDGKILVTGGAGFIGSTFVRRRLAATDDTIVVLDKLTYAGTLANLDGVDETRCRFVRGDIADGAVVAPLVAEVDAIVSFAAESHVDRSILDPEAFLRTGVTGVHVLLEAARAERDRRGPGGRIRLVQVSTDEVYGESMNQVDETHKTEHSILCPTNPYAATKAGAELIAPGILSRRLSQET